MKAEVNDAAVRIAMSSLRRLGGDPANYLPAVGGVVKESTRMRFITGQGPDGRPWAPVIRGGSPLRDTGTHLMNSVNFQVQGNSVTVGVPYAWASVHQFGKTIHAKNAPFLMFKIGNAWVRKRTVTIPARPMFGINGQDRTEIVKALIRSILPQSAQ